MRLRSYAWGSERQSFRSLVCGGWWRHDEAVPDVGAWHSVPGVVDGCGVDELGLRLDAVVGAEVEHLLGLGEAAGG